MINSFTQILTYYQPTNQIETKTVVTAFVLVELEYSNATGKQFQLFILEVT